MPLLSSIKSNNMTNLLSPSWWPLLFAVLLGLPMLLAFSSDWLLMSWMLASMSYSITLLIIPMLIVCNFIIIVVTERIWSFWNRAYATRMKWLCMRLLGPFVLSEMLLPKNSHLPSPVLKLIIQYSSFLSYRISVLQLFLSSPKPTLRFAAVRTLNKVLNNIIHSFILFIMFFCDNSIGCTYSSTRCHNMQSRYGEFDH